MGETYDEVAANKALACKTLKKLKEVESKTKLHSVRLDKNTVVFCKNKERIEDFKKL